MLHFFDQLQEFLPRLVLEELVDDRIIEMSDEYAKRSVLEDTLLPNIVTYHKSGSGAPVVFEHHPSYANLFGRIEFSSDQGALVTNYRRISPGALHKANGGYLLLEAEKVLTEPLVWEALKRAIQARQLKMESPYSELGLISTTTLIPEVIPLDVKLVLVGSRRLYTCCKNTMRIFAVYSAYWWISTTIYRWKMTSSMLTPACSSTAF